MTPSLVSSTLAPCLAALVLSTTTQAGFVAAVTPPFSTSPCARAAGWEVFTHPHAAPNFPDVTGATAASAAITQLVPGAFLTSSGNIYSPTQPTEFRLTHTAAADVQEVVFQISTLGNAPEIGSFTLTYAGPGGGDVVLAPTDFLPLVQVPGQQDELYFRWDLSAVPDAVLEWRVEWTAAAPSMSLDAVLLDILLECPAGTSFCAGDGSATACPCGNDGAAGNGCASSVNPAGASLASSGVASLAHDTLTLVGNGMPDSSCLYLQGSAALAGGLGTVFGDGLRCVGGAITRLGPALNVAGASAHPGPAHLPLSQRGGIVTPGTVVPYQVWYRNAAAFCTPSGFNLSNGYSVTWLP